MSVESEADPKAELSDEHDIIQKQRWVAMRVRFLFVTKTVRTVHQVVLYFIVGFTSGDYTK